MIDIDPIWLLIFGMAAVTYLPRLAPFLFLNPDRWPRALRRGLERVPYAALGALIFPDILSAGESWWFGLSGGLIAGTLALLRLPLFFVIACTVILMSLVAAWT